MFPLNWNIPFIRKNGSRTTLGAITGNIAGIEEDVAELISQTDGLWDNMIENGAVNLLPFDLDGIIARNTSGTWSGNNYTASGITFIVNNDGSITVNGTATENATIFLFKNGNDFLKDGAKYKASSAVYNENAFMYINGVGRIEPSTTFTFSSTAHTSGSMYIRVLSGKTVSDLTFYPMITLPSYKGPYVPYVMSNRKLTEVVESIEAEMVKGGGYVYAIPDYFYHITIKGTQSSGQYLKLITLHGDVKAFTSNNAFSSNVMNRQKILLNDNADTSEWTFSINGLTLNLNCTGHITGWIVSNGPLTFTTTNTSTPEANALSTLNLALLSNS